jgi:hypothetical protein
VDEGENEAADEDGDLQVLLLARDIRLDESLGDAVVLVTVNNKQSSCLGGGGGEYVVQALGADKGEREDLGKKEVTRH